jgi:hypothetical protein
MLPPGALRCPEYCEPLMQSLSFPACCTADGECGTNLGGLAANTMVCYARDQPGEPHPDCPDEVLAIFASEPENSPLTFEGCCKPEGVCGVSGPAPLALGCLERSLAGPLLGSPLATLGCGPDDDAGI